MQSRNAESYENAIRFLYGLQSFGIKLGLRNIRKILHTLRDPQGRFRVIHIAGTNGKGSTAAMLASILTASGKKTGLYTSPHLVDFTERIRIDGVAIPREEVVRWSNKVERIVRRTSATFFEAVTAMAFGYFARERVDWGVVETGLGGRLDATNVVHPELTIITSIGKEHTAILGSTLDAIAREKAGIIKKNIPCVSGVESQTAARVIRAAAKAKQAPLSSSTSGKVVVRIEEIAHTTVDVDGPYGQWKDLKLGLGGHFQVRNLRTVLAAVNALRKIGVNGLEETAVRDGLRRVGELSGISGRMTVVQEDPRVIVDVAHNPEAMRALVAALRQLDVERVHLVFGAASDKDAVSMIRALRPILIDATAVAAHTHRSFPVDVLKEMFQSEKIAVRAGTSVESAVRGLIERSKPTSTILVTGSHFVVGEAVAWMAGKQYLTISQ